VSRGLDKIKKERGEDTSGLAGLTLDSDYGKNQHEHGTGFL